MPEEITWEWNPKQALYIATPKRYAAYVGSHGCGKTAAFCRRAIAIAVKYPGSRILLARYTYPETNETLVPQFMENCPQGLIKDWSKSAGVLELHAGRGSSIILFRNLEDAKKFRSENLNAFGISQADDEGITEEHWDELTKRLRRMKGPYGLLPKQYAFIEANYRGHNWIWQLFTHEGQVTSGRLQPDGSRSADAKGFDPEQYLLVEGQTQDNQKNLPDEYIADMEAMPDEWKKRYYYGSWDELGGLVYEEFKPSNVAAGIMTNGQWQAEIPWWWNRYRAVDHGTRAVTVCLWATVSPSGTVYIYDEYYQPGLALKHAEKIFRKHAVWDDKSQSWVPTEKYRWTVIDRAAFNQESTGESPADQYFAKGIPLVRAPASERDVGGGISVVKRYLTELDPTTGRPRLQIVARRCPNLVREMKEYVWDELGPRRRQKQNEPERPRKVNDHAMDAMRYLLVSRPQPSADVAPKIIETPPPGSIAELRQRSKHSDGWDFWEV